MTRKLATPRTPIGKRVRFAREVEGITQAELAARSGIARETVSRIESGAFERPQALTLAELAGALRVNPRWMFGHSDAFRPGAFFVYTLRGQDRRALFVGLCANLQAQLDRHRRLSRWVREVKSVDYRLCQSEAVALEARDRLVAELIPVWNVEQMAAERTKLVRSA